MEKLGKEFSRDKEFTGCCDVTAAMSSKLINSLGKQGMKLPQGNTVQSSALKFPQVRAYMEPGDDQVAVIDLNDDQKAMIQELIGEDRSQLQITVTSSDASKEIPLTQDQQSAISKALGLDMTSLTIEREPVEVYLR
ncbi:MAG: hypothetical protein QNK04_20460 [Myxococcota bacterium]|nr:hypothetical protein [Myxococcota bacterium]